MSRPRVLLVDDREDSLVALEATLRRNDCDLLMARSGREALELLLVEEVALALVDVQMPEMDGFELAELMRGTERARSIPIIFITAGLHDSTRIFKGYESGAVDLLMKPLDPYILRSKVEVFLELYRQREQLAERVRELKRAEAGLREADRRKDEFLAVLSHELRNPLMPVRNALFILERAEPGGEQARAALAVIDRQTRHLTRLVDDLMDVTRVTRGKVELRLDAVCLPDIVRQTVEDHRVACGDAEVEVTLQLPPEPLMLSGDATRLAQIVGNLLGNAMKFTPPRGRISLSVRRDGSDALLCVKDDGVGIQPEVLERLFAPFAQADRTLARSRGGLGLGLALVKSLAELHGGSVAVRSEGPGMGTEVEVRLPLLAAAAQPECAADSAPIRRERRRVLVVEDNPDGAAVLQETIELMGHEVAVAHEGRSALARARTFRPDVVLCDIGLPGMDGYEVARQFKMDAELREVRLVALTGYALPEDKEHARNAGFSEHLAKPPEPEALDLLLARAGVAPPRRLLGGSGG